MDELQRLSVEEFHAATKSSLHLVLDNVRSLSNVGGIFRTADAFLVQRIHLCGITPKPPHREIQKTALGATESVAWEAADDTASTIAALKGKGIVPIAVEQCAGSVPLDQWEPEPNREYAFVFGHEVMGVDQAVVDQCEAVVDIPQFGTKHSLNVATSAGIVLWEVFRKLKRANRWG